MRERSLRSKPVIASLVALVVCLVLPAPAVARNRVAPSSNPNAARFVHGELVVRFKPGVGEARRSALRAKHGASLKEKLPIDGVELVRVPPGLSVADSVARWARLNEVTYAEPNYLYRATATTPNDWSFGDQIGLKNTGQLGGVPGADIHAPEAWDIRTSGSLVAVVDTGIDLDHPDLADRLWTNTGESGNGKETNNVDDDGNGKKDDYRGWDWVGTDDNDPQDENGHGTHVAGIIAARGNDGRGVTGVSWNTKIMALRVLDAEGNGAMSNIAAAFAYAAQEGAHIVNASLGGADDSATLRAAVEDHPGVLYVVAAGNEGTDNDASPIYPCAFPYTNLVCVAASDASDTLADFAGPGASNFGRSSVDLAAPGVNILSTYPNVTAGRTTATSLTDSGDGNYLPSLDHWIRRTGSLDLSLASGCIWTFYANFLMYGSDAFRAEASTNLTDWTTLATGEGNSLWDPDTAIPPVDGLSVIDVSIPDSKGYVKVDVDLADLEGESATYLRFRMTSDASVNREGVHIDDMSVACSSGFTTITEGFESDISAAWTLSDPSSTWARATSAFELEYLTGTSMAAPHVAGAASLVFATRPAGTSYATWVTHTKNVLLGSTDRKSALSGKVKTGGRLNLKTALDCAPDLTAPVNAKVIGADMALDFQKSRTFEVLWSASDGVGCDIRSYDVRYRRARYDGGFSSHVTSKSGTTANGLDFTGTYGYTYCFSVRARDKAYNLSGWSNENCTAIPVDDDGLSPTPSWVEHNYASGYFGSDYMSSSTYSAAMRLTWVEYRTLHLIATKCPGCGKVRVYSGSTALATIDLSTGTGGATLKNQSLLIKDYPSGVYGPTTIKIRIVSTGKVVKIEGLGVSRT